MKFKLRYEVAIEYFQHPRQNSQKKITVITVVPSLYLIMNNVHFLDHMRCLLVKECMNVWK